MNRITLTILLIVIGVLSQSNAAEVIGPHVVRAPDSALLVDGPITGHSIGWLNVVNTPVDVSAAFSGQSIIDDGYANLEQDTTIEVMFNTPVVNRAGPDLVLYEAQFDEGAYAVSTEFDRFTSTLQLQPTDDFISTGIVREYYFERTAGLFPATVFAAEIDLTDLGLPAGAAVQKVRFSTTNTEADPLGIGALVPSPSTFALCVGFGIATVFNRARREDR